MLVLTRRVGQTIFIGDDIAIKLLLMTENFSSIGIDAPKDLRILRSELYRGKTVKKEDFFDKYMCEWILKKPNDGYIGYELHIVTSCQKKIIPSGTALFKFCPFCSREIKDGEK